jgi:acyl CoA:acetate/3-ketoacid CoA transferase alpha subunit
LYHTPITADVTVVEAYEADEAGNLIFRRTQRNFSDTMCYAGKTVIAVVEHIRKNGELDPDKVMVPGPVVDYLVQKEA